MIQTINNLAEDIHTNNVKYGWWNDPETGVSLIDSPYVIATKMLLVITEMSEAVEGYRKGLPDDHLPHRSMVETELADAMIRILDIAGALKLDLGGAISEKLSYNSTRPDHKVENRVKKGGKKF